MQLYREKTIKYSKYNVLLIYIDLSRRYFLLMSSQKLCETDVDRILVANVSSRIS